MPNSFAAFAAELTSHLLSDALLYTDYKSGVFLAGRSEALSADFLSNHLAPALSRAGATVVSLQPPSAKGPKSLEEVGAALWAHMEKSKLEQYPSSLSEIVLRATATGTSFALLLNQVEDLTLTSDGVCILMALKACRDAVNLRPGAHGSFLLVAAGTHMHRLTTMVCDSSQPFYGSTLLQLPA
ncbi:hypothetical protein ABT364_05750 [Massilia sp. SR12]